MINNLVGLLPALKLEHLHLLILQFFVILKEAVNLVEDVLRQLLDIRIVRHRFIAIGHRDDLVVLLSLVDHSHHTDHLRVHQTQRLHLGRTDHQNIQRIVVVAVGLRNEAVVRGIVNGTEQNAIQLQKTALLVQLILDLAFSWNLDQCSHHLRCSLALRNCVPGIGSESCSLACAHVTTQQFIYFLKKICTYLY